MSSHCGAKSDEQVSGVLWPFGSMTVSTALMAAVAVLIAAAVGGGVLTGCSGEKETTTKKPAAPDPLALAPADAIGIVRVDVKAIAADLLDQLGQAEEPLLPPPVLEAVKKLADRVDSVDVFLVDGSAEAPPTLFAVVRGSLTVDDLVSAAASMTGGEKPPYTEVRPGVYDSNAGPAPIRAIFGSEAPEADDGVVLVGLQPMMTDDFIKNLGTGDVEALRKLLAGVDTSVPIHGGIVLDVIDDPEAPRSLAGSIDPRRKGGMHVALEFKDVKFAREFSASLVDFRGKAMLPALEITASGKLAVVECKWEGGILESVIPGVMRARQLARRALSAANLQGIGKGVLMYAAENEDRIPQHLGELVTVEWVPLEILISPSGKTPREGWDPKAGKVPGDYVYLRVPLDAPEGLIMAYERPELNKGEGTNVLHVDGSVRWVTPEEYAKLLADTKAWLAANRK